MSTDSAKPRRLSDGQVGLILVAPAVLLLAGVALYPLISSVVAGFYHQSLLSPDRTFTGLSNLRAALDSGFWHDLRNTLWFTLWATVVPVVLGLALALALNTLSGRAALRAFFLLPWVLPGVVTSFIWLWIFNANYGVLNGLLRDLGIIHHNVNWLGSPGTAFMAVIVAKSWSSFPWIALMFLAGLQTIDTALYEAAEIDGAGRWTRFRKITLPRLRPVLITVVLLEGTWNVQHFETIYVLTNGGPAGSTTTLSIDVYRTAFSAFDMGRAGALGLLWMVLLTVLIIVYLRVSNRVEED